MSEAHQTSIKLYVYIFAALIVALAASLVLGAYSTGPGVIAIIFAVATVKAWLVLGYFVNLNREPRFVKVLVACLVLLLLTVFIGFYFDVTAFWAGTGT